MKRAINYFLIVAVASVLAIIYAAPDWIVDPPIHRDAITLDSPKNYQDTCTGHETSGHCADKCPDWSYTLIGFDPVTGQAICQPESTSATAPTVYNAIKPSDTATAESFAGK